MVLTFNPVEELQMQNLINDLILLDLLCVS